MGCWAVDAVVVAIAQWQRQWQWPRQAQLGQQLDDYHWGAKVAEPVGRAREDLAPSCIGFDSFQNALRHF